MAHFVFKCNKEDYLSVSDISTHVTCTHTFRMLVYALCIQLRIIIQTMPSVDICRRNTKYAEPYIHSDFKNTGSHEDHIERRCMLFCKMCVCLIQACMCRQNVCTICKYAYMCMNVYERTVLHTVCICILTYIHKTVYTAAIALSCTYAYCHIQMHMHTSYTLYTVTRLYAKIPYAAQFFLHIKVHTVTCLYTQSQIYTHSHTATRLHTQSH